MIHTEISDLEGLSNEILNDINLCGIKPRELFKAYEEKRSRT